MARPRKKKSNVLSLNFKGVDISARQVLPEGDYVCSVAEIEQAESSAGNDMLKWTFEVAEGEEGEGSKLYVYTTLDQASLWKLGQLLDAMGMEIPDGELDLDLEEILGSMVVLTVAHETYEGKPRAKVVDFLPVDGDGDEAEEEEEEEPAPKKGAKGKASKKAPEPEEDEEDEEPAPPKKGAKGKAKKKAFEPVAAEDIQGMGEDELNEIIEGAELDLDLDDYSTLRKARAAVIDALEEKGLIAEADDEEEEEEEPAPKRKRR
jgi:hypothetical protein